MSDEVYDQDPCPKIPPIFVDPQRKAFVCDGMACNWSLQAKHFSRFVPILDFVHALCYLYHAAIGGQPITFSLLRSTGVVSILRLGTAHVGEGNRQAVGENAIAPNCDCTKMKLGPTCR
ncbi:MAG: hypothetical protein GXP26_11875 [Planctomycetes bacterium]|nr:hypothetical protein [Planctomycetota bacterium]